MPAKEAAKTAKPAAAPKAAAPKAAAPKAKVAAAKPKTAGRVAKKAKTSLVTKKAV